MALTAQTNSRIANSSRAWQQACNVDVTGWTKTNEFILSTWAHATSVNPDSDCKLQWRRSGGTFADVTATTEVCWGTGTVLVNDAVLLESNTAGCFVDWDDGKENEGDNLCYLLNIKNGDYGEVQWALGFGSGALNSQEYEIQFVVIDWTSSAICQTSITTSAGGTEYNESGADTGEFSDSTTNLTTQLGSSSDTVEFSDTSSTDATSVTSTSDTGNLSDSSSATAEGNASSSDTIDFSDSSTVDATAEASASDTMEFSDTSTTIITTSADSSDTVEFSDTATTTVIVASSPSDTINFGDSSSSTVSGGGQEYNESGSDTVNFSDSATYTVIYPSSASDTLEFSDSSTVNIIVQSSKIDSIIFSDPSITVVESLTSASDTIKFSETTSKVVVVVGEAADTVEFSDLVTGTSPAGYFVIITKDRTYYFVTKNYDYYIE